MKKRKFGVSLEVFFKLRLISKFMTSQTGKQITTIHMLPNISRSTGDQTMVS